MPSPLFADKTRTDPGIQRAAESTYRFLDRIDDPVFERVRVLLNAWIARFEEMQSPAAVNDVIGRLRSKQDLQFYAAFWELYLHEVHANLGFTIDVHPESARDGRPDFVLQRQGARFYMEAVMPSPSAGVTELPKNAQVVLEQLDRARADDFMLSVQFVAGGPATPKTRRTAGAVEDWLATLRWDDWWRDGLDADIAYPETQLTVGDWIIGVRAWPRSPELRGDPDFPTVVTPPSFSGWPDGMADALVPTLEEKAAKYGDLDAPYVIAVFVMSAMSSAGTAGRVLFGSEVPLDPGRHPTGFAGSRLERRGLWTKEGPKRGRVSGVLAAPSFDFNYSAIARALPRYWSNPWADRPLDVELPFPSTHVEPDEANVENRPASVQAHELVDLPQDWPGQPFQSRRK